MRAGLTALRHRGPDDEGVELLEVPGATLAFGHTRLSIIDLSASGHQPMRSIDGRHVIVFNGEIYNYRELRDELKALGHSFRTGSDTEVLLACWSQWGADCLPRLIGMFAFAILDRTAQTLTLVRDAFGIKPLFFRIDGEGLAFASELPALLKLLRAPPGEDVQTAYDYLVDGDYDDQPDTFFQCVRRLQPAHLLTVDLSAYPGHATNSSAWSGAKPVRWWWPSIAERTDLTFEQAAEQLRDMFLASVRLHLRSDVPVGAALSGGIDSSAVVCAMRHLEPDMPIHTFSFIAADPVLNEEKWIDRVNQFVGATPHKTRLDPERFAASLGALVEAQGEPFGTTSIYAQYEVFRDAAANGIKVILNGQGADETLGGYEAYPAPVLRSMYEAGNWAAVPTFMRGWRQRFGRTRSDPARVLLSSILPARIKSMLAPDRGGRAVRDRLLAGTTGGRRNPPQHGGTGPEGRGRRLAQTLRDELVISRIPRLLRYDDRNAMHWSIESRVPFLTIPLAEFLLSLPEHYLISRTSETKSLFRKAMRGIVPDEILDRTDKIGFDVPERKLVGDAWPAIRRTVAHTSAGGVLNRGAALAWLDEVFRGGHAYRPAAWRTLSLMLWEDRFSSSGAAPCQAADGRALVGSVNP